MKHNLNQRVLNIIAQMTAEEKLLCVHGQLWDPYRANQAGFVRGSEKHGIPDVFIADGESGVNISWETTSFPSKVALASTFDRASAFAYGKAMGREAKASGIHLLLTPRVNVVRDPVGQKGVSNGGNYQTYGEDPVLNGELGAQEALGIQDRCQALANLKQMFGSSNGTAQGAGNCIIDEQTIHELYLRPYELVLKAGVSSAMTNYNQVNGTWTYDYAHLTQECAREKWGFEGFIFDDWFCLYDPNAIQHGVTLEMPGSDYYDEGSEFSCYGKGLLAAIEDPAQRVTMEDLDRAVYYYLDTLCRFGMLDEAQRIPGPLDEKTKLESAALAREIAAKGAVLLKNENHLLPISFEGKRIAVIGPGGGQQAMPTFKESPYGFPDRKSSLHTILKEQCGEAVTYARGIELDGTVIPSENLSTEAHGGACGLKRYTAKFIYETLSDGTLQDFPRWEAYTVDPVIDYRGATALPPLPSERRKGFFKETPRTYYMWHGYIRAEETGEYRLSVQSKFPGLDAFEKNQVQNADLSVSTSGNLYLRKARVDAGMTRVGAGVRISANGKLDPFSEVVPCADGWNNAGGWISLEAGELYEVYFNHISLHMEPLEMRLTWVTPSMAQAALEEAALAARGADLAIVFAFHQSVSETMTLAGGQNRLIEAVSRENPNTVVVLNNGDPVDMPWLGSVPAVLEMWFSGQEGALATMDVLSGAVNPAGRLPVTFPKKLTDIAARDPRYPERCCPSGRISERDAQHPNTAHFTEGLLNGYRWFDRENIEPLYPFGFGLSYTRFAYGKLAVIPEGERFTVTCEVENTGARDGEEVVQCYLTRPEVLPQGIQAADKVLVDFCRVFIPKGEKRTVTLRIDELYLSYFDPQEMENKRLPGTREVLIGASSRDIRLTGHITIE